MVAPPEQIIPPTKKATPDLILKQDAEKILWQQLDKKTDLAVQEIPESDKKDVPSPVPPAVSSIQVPLPKAEEMAKVEAIRTEPKTEALKEEKSDSDEKSANRSYAKRSFDARSINHQKNHTADFNYEAREAKTVAAKSPPLLVVDGKPVTAKPNSNEDLIKSGLSKIDPDDVESIIILKEPLYIINNNYYSEQELFGPNPTSPYHPLNQQEIETLSILQGEKATAAYGKKGEKGVVIITTKNGKSVKIPPRRE